MATIPDSLMATIVAGWTGAGGAIPTGQYVSEDFTTTGLPAKGGEYIWINSLFKTVPDPVNDAFEHRTHVVYIKVNTSTDADRRKEVGDEVVRILNSTAIAGVSWQKVTDRDRIRPDLVIGQQSEMIEVTLKEFMVSSGSAHGAGATGDFTVTGDIISSSVYSHEKANMLGVANAAWVHCGAEGWGTTATWFAVTANASISNKGADDGYISYVCSEPPRKGTLKLYVSGTRIMLADADATDYITNTFTIGIGDSGIVVLDNDPTDKTTIDLHEDPFTAVDCSPYHGVKILLKTVNSGVGDLDVQGVTLRCYYDT